MAGGTEPSSDGMISGINVTPFVDVVLVLLIVFLVTAKLVAQPPSTIPLTLPKASSAEVRPSNITLSIERSGQVSLEGVRVTDATMALQVHELGLKTPGLKVILAVDGDVPHRRVVQVMGLLRNAQIQDIGFAVIPEGTAGVPVH